MKTVPEASVYQIFLFVFFLWRHDKEMKLLWLAETDEHLSLEIGKALKDSALH